jgi:lipopolysaccharide biosynthesis glycosyltransferase
MNSLQIYIGYDPRESVAYHTLVQSLMDNSSKPLAITPINLRSLNFNRPRDPKQSTDFAFTRFLVPYLSGYRGASLFMDSDILCTGDIAELFDERDSWCAVQVVKHDYTPKTQTKFLGNAQTVYEKKNWSSVMLFNNFHYDCQRLTLDAVESMTGLELHQFHWTKRVGELSPKWNYLVGESPKVESPKLIHYTLGGPYFNETRNCEYAKEWFDAKARMLRCDQ